MINVFSIICTLNDRNLVTIVVRKCMIRLGQRHHHQNELFIQILHQAYLKTIRNHQLNMDLVSISSTRSQWRIQRNWIAFDRKKTNGSCDFKLVVILIFIKEWNIILSKCKFVLIGVVFQWTISFPQFVSSKFALIQLK